MYYSYYFLKITTNYIYIIFDVTHKIENRSFNKYYYYWYKCKIIHNIITQNINKTCVKRYFLFFELEELNIFRSYTVYQCVTLKKYKYILKK